MASVARVTAARWRRTLPVLATVLIGALIVSGWGPSTISGASAGAASGHRPRRPPAGQLGGAFSSSSVESVIAVLARDGVATVADESSSRPLKRVSGVSRLVFTRAQVRSMALGAANQNGIKGSTLDATFPVPAGVPPISY